MRPNVARPWPASSVPDEGGDWLSGAVLRGAPAPLVEVRKEDDERVELVGRKVLERGHRRGRVDQRTCDRLLGQTFAAVGQRRARPVVSVVAELVAGQAARLGGHLLARLVLPEHRGALRG